MEKTIMTGETFYVNHTDSFKREDIVAFDFWGNDYSSYTGDNTTLPQHWEKRIYRIAALSGDTLEIKNGDVYINGRYVTAPEHSVTEYEVVAKEMIEEFASDDGFVPFTDDKGLLHYTVNLSKSEVADYLNRKRVVTDITKKLMEYNSTDTFLAKSCDTCQWTADNFGPVYIPVPGESFTVNTANFKLYHNIPGIHIGKNVLAEKLYFMMGDNRHHAEDSRYIGFITHSKINGIVK
jgi:signal peptidase I